VLVDCVMAHWVGCSTLSSQGCITTPRIPPHHAQNSPLFYTVEAWGLPALGRETRDPVSLYLLIVSYTATLEILCLAAMWAFFMPTSTSPSTNARCAGDSSSFLFRFEESDREIGVLRDIAQNLIDN
jgi:hypothetical protein